MKAPLSWMREFADLPGDPGIVAGKLGNCGFEVAAIDGDTIDVEITANRPDCLSVLGLAREAATAFDVPLKPPPAAAVPAGHAAVPVSVGDAGCRRYAAAVADVTVGPSPGWLADRLTAAGVRPINNIVDVTNYVMLECGHPLHAFDLAKLAGPEIRVRRARDKETLVTLDGVTRTLDEAMLVIADREGPIALAGVMGGAASEVSAATTRVAIESAWFLPGSVRATSRRLGLKTEASARFERGADLTAPAAALARALALLEQIGAGRVHGGLSDVYPRAYEPRTVSLARARLSGLLGDTIPDPDVERTLSRLGFGLTRTPDGWQAVVPPFRVDVARDVDLIEDIGRHWGFDRLPSRFPPLRELPREVSPAVARDRLLRRVLTGAGLQEAWTFTFIEREAAVPFVAAGSEPVVIANPLSEKFAVLRPSLLPGLLDAVIYNRRREAEQVRLFETGSVFSLDEESSRVGWLMTGPRATHWSSGNDACDVFDATGIAELVGDALGVAVSARPAADAPWFTPGRAAVLVVGDDETATVVGTAGEIRPAIVAARGLGAAGAIVGGEIDPARVEAAAAATSRIRPLPRFPSIVRDISIVVSNRLPAADVRGTIRSTAPDTLVSVREFDRYQGTGVPDGSVSLSFRLTFRHIARTMTDAEAQRAVEAIVRALVERHGAVLRGGA